MDFVQVSSVSCLIVSSLARRSPDLFYQPVSHTFTQAHVDVFMYRSVTCTGAFPVNSFILGRQGDINKDGVNSSQCIQGSGAKDDVVRSFK